MAEILKGQAISVINRIKVVTLKNTADVFAAHV
jgi:hypothetical protein